MIVEQRLVFFGAGSAGIGVADMIVAMMVEGCVVLAFVFVFG